MRGRDPDQVTIRRRTDADVHECLRVLAEVHQQDGYPTIWPDDPRAWLSSPDLIAAWVAEVNGEVVGQVGLARPAPDDVAPSLWSSRTGSEPRNTTVVTRLFLSPRARGIGLATALMNAAEEDAQRKDLHPVLEVVTHDASAVAFYERLGWAYLGQAEQLWGPDWAVMVRCYAAP